ncbi:hypothetical protein Purlil1_13268 [Purpureocillium lilacinum]|uniref:Uncharacterized protein n=1 Tax=Purpureocillium lilacinum TaxID=33203 RepID=A0ABR0BEK6_PURLI|nr:hypothetical protein Purlil1_13268 [Purpureocillium lilacinum]
MANYVESAHCPTLLADTATLCFGAEKPRLACIHSPHLSGPNQVLPDRSAWQPDEAPTSAGGQESAQPSVNQPDNTLRCRGPGCQSLEAYEVKLALMSLRMEAALTEAAPSQFAISAPAPMVSETCKGSDRQMYWPEGCDMFAAEAPNANVLTRSCGVALRPCLQLGGEGSSTRIHSSTEVRLSQARVPPNRRTLTPPPQIDKALGKNARVCSSFGTLAPLACAIPP